MKGVFFLLMILTFNSYAETKGNLELRAFVPLTAKTSVNQYNVSPKEALVVLSNQVNSDLILESQKIEIEGVTQAGMEAHLKKVVTNNRTVQYHLLINRLKSTAANDKPIFVKISAN